MERIPINPGVVDWSGENPGMYLKEAADGPFVTLISFFRVVRSPCGRGHAAFLFLDPHGEGKAPGRENVCRVSYTITKGYVFLKGSRTPEDAKRFVRWTMATDRYIKYLHTVPGHMGPVLADVARSDTYFNHPLIKANRPVQEKFIEIMGKPTSMPIHMEDGGLNLNAVQLLDGPHVIEMVQSVIIRGDAAKAAVGRAAQRLRAAGVA